MSIVPQKLKDLLRGQSSLTSNDQMNAQLKAQSDFEDMIKSMQANLTNQLSRPLSASEEERYKELEREQVYASKMLKINYFKSLPRGLRQHVVDTLTWHEEVTNMNNMLADAPTLLKELAQRRMVYGGPSNWIINNNTSGFGHYWTQNTASSIVPSGITAEELISAHLDATLEEGLAGVKEDE